MERDLKRAKGNDGSKIVTKSEGLSPLDPNASASQLLALVRERDAYVERLQREV